MRDLQIRIQRYRKTPNLFSSKFKFFFDQNLDFVLGCMLHDGIFLVCHWDRIQDVIDFVRSIPRSRHSVRRLPFDYLLNYLNFCQRRNNIFEQMEVSISILRQPVV